MWVHSWKLQSLQVPGELNLFMRESDCVWHESVLNGRMKYTEVLESS